MHAFLVGHDVRVKDGLLDAAILLGNVIVKRNHGVLAQARNRVQVRYEPSSAKLPTKTIATTPTRKRFIA